MAKYAAVASVIGITGISTWMLQDKSFSFERRSYCLSDDIPHIVNVETGYIHADEKAGEHLSKLKNEKAYVKYYFPTEKFVPLDELPIVFLNGMKFYHQGKDIYDDGEKSFLKLNPRTRSSKSDLKCDGAIKYKKYRSSSSITSTTTRTSTTTSTSTTSTTTSTTTSSAISTTTSFGFNFPNFQPFSYPQEASNNPVGRYANQPEPETEVPKQQTDYSYARTNILGSSFFADMLAFFGDDLNDSKVDSDPDILEFTSQSDSNAQVQDNQTQIASVSETSVTTTVKPKLPQIGCCNGIPYNSNKRCCCRRVAFNKDTKFCCAINGCENFKIFDRSDPKNFDLCKGLSGLVVQEYGYRGQYKGEPIMKRLRQRQDD